MSYAGTENCFHGALNARCLGINEVLVSDSNRCEALNALDVHLQCYIAGGVNNPFLQPHFPQTQ